MERGEIKRVKALPAQGLARHHFSQIGVNGLGDPLNAYAHSMAWYQGHLYVGSTRSNLCMLKVSKISTPSAARQSSKAAKRGRYK